ncbi:hypothetical protein D0862_07096 [Hortaea werneckii]|uniref:Endo-1,3(4)-beta-glucanase 1 carbohydrate binding domain-containing protein n=1 Tax=Hortaea werneckii TaxID=91943 RepID=A0A3M7GED9_HORWE|nr:hypothetical protein D0862_07096 [Hortaea werneckii]
MPMYTILLTLLVALVALTIAANVPADSNLIACGDAYYLSTQYTCYDGSFLCPIQDGEPTLRCGDACYNPRRYSCSKAELTSISDHEPPTSPGINSSTSPPTNAFSPAQCSEEPTTLQLSDPPYENYFYSDCNSASQVVVTSPLSDSNLSIIGPRLLVAWPAGNSGVVAFFEPIEGPNGTLAIHLVNETGATQPLQGGYKVSSDTSDSVPDAHVSTLVNFNTSARLTVPILGSIRTIRDFTEGPSILVPELQDAVVFSQTENGGAILSRVWLDNVTTTTMSFTPTNATTGTVSINNRTLEFAAGTYNFTSTLNYPQLEQLSASEVLNEASQDLLVQSPDQTKSLSFLSYTNKLLAGAWRFLTYFGRDSMISLLLLQPVLSGGEGGAIEAVISAVLERINSTDGSVCHEETIGDYATYLHLQENVTSTAPICSYIMIDSDYFLMPVMQNYFLATVTGRRRREAFFSTKASLDFGNQGTTYGELARINAERVMRIAGPFAQPGGQSEGNLVHLKEGEVVGEWRDSTYGIGGGRIPYDVNTALVPAALRSIAALASVGFFPEHPEWSQLAEEYAAVWEDETLAFFKVVVPPDQARELVTDYANEAGYGFPSNASSINSEIVYHGLALDGNNNQPLVKVMNTDDCFRHFLLNTTNQDQLTSYLNSTANNILSPFPVGLSTPVGLLVANPAYGGDPVYAANFTNNAYHGTVVWGWQMAMMAAGLERQLDRCMSGGVTSTTNISSSTTSPTFCTDAPVYENVLAAYNHLWDLIEANAEQLSSEVWSWLYEQGFVFEPLGALPPPAGQSPTESNIRQLWSLTFLAVTRNEDLR